MRTRTILSLAALLCFGPTAWGESSASDPEPISADQWVRTAANATQPEEEPPPVTEADPLDEETMMDEPLFDPDLDPFFDDPFDLGPSELVPEIEIQLQDVHEIELSELQALGEKIDALLTGAVIRLGIHDCVQLALEYNQDILITSYEPIKAYGDYVAAKGQYDVLLSGQLSKTELRQSAPPQTVAFGGITSIENETANARVALSGQLHYGTQYEVSLRSEVEEGTFNQFMREYSSALTATLTQPLLRGFGQGVNLARIRVAKNNMKISEIQLELAVLTALGDVLKAYWDLVGAVENLRVREEALKNAERVVDINQRRLDIGLAAPLEVSTAKAGVSTRIFDLINARRAIADAETRLKSMLNMRDGDYLSDSRIIPVDRPADDFQYEFDEQFSMRLALQNRPEIRRQELSIENAEIERRRARNDVLPQLDVQGTWIFGGRNQKLSKTFTGIRNKQDDVMTIGIVGSIPIGNRTARGNYHRARSAVSQEEQRMEQTENQLMLAVKLAGFGVITNQVLIENNRIDRLLQEAVLAAEIRRLELGASTSQRVLDFQEDLTLAQVQEVQAKIEAEKSLIDLQVAEGTLLDAYGVEFDIPEYERPLNTIDSLLDR